jgi:hypothetical protein
MKVGYRLAFLAFTLLAFVSTGCKGPPGLMCECGRINSGDAYFCKSCGAAGPAQIRQNNSRPSTTASVRCQTCNKWVEGEKGTKERCKNCDTLVPIPQ